jgi:uncharacterized protein YjdB
MKIKTLLLALLILFVLPQTVFASDFEQYINYTTGSWPEAVAIGDVNGDGKNDVVMTTSYYFDPANDYMLFVFLQNSTGGLEQPLKYPANGKPYSVDIGDLNNDGKNDVVVGNNTNIELFLQNQAGGLDPGYIYSTANSRSIKTGDFNNDGLTDVAGIGWGSGSIDIMLQNNEGLLGLPLTYAVEHGGYDELEAGDVNNDGLIDLIVMSGQMYAIPNIGILYQQVEGFSLPVYYSVGTNINTHGVAVGDINSDNLNDVIVSYGGNQPTSFIGTFKQNTQGALDPAVNYAAYDCPEAVEVADVNCDGRMDVLVLNGGWNTLSVYLQDTSGLLTAYSRYQIPYASHYNPQGLAAGDFNSDGKPDIAIADYNNGLVILYSSTVIPVTDISLNKTAATLAAGETATLSATITPSNATNQSIIWASDNPAIAEVDESGKVTAIAPGTARITAATTDGSNLSATCTVTVEPAYVAVTGVTLNKTIAYIPVNGTDQLTASIIPEDATTQDVTWISSNSAIATVSTTGLVKALKPGTALITVKTIDGGFTATCEVIVKKSFKR